MQIKCLGTGSKGNAYIISQEGITYLLDCGVDLKKITANINLNNLDFCFISHEHKDHSLNLENLRFRGVEIIEGKFIRDFTEIASISLKSSNLRVFALPIEHGSCKNAALIVKTANECLLYATDFNLCKYDLKTFKFTHLLVECNYDDNLMLKAPKDIKHLRQINTHMSYEGLKKFISLSIDFKKVKELYLIHLSNEAELIDKDIILEKAKRDFKCKVGICKHFGGVDFGG